MEIFGVNRVEILSVKAAAIIHRVPLDEFIDIINKAVKGDIEAI
jgi:hypothetical protein